MSARWFHVFASHRFGDSLDPSALMHPKIEAGSAGGTELYGGERKYFNNLYPVTKIK